MMFKNPDPAVLDFQKDWSNWLSVGDTIATSVWSVGTGIVVDSEVSTTTTATAVISGGVAGQTYIVKNTITTANGLTTSRTWSLRVQIQTI